MVLGQGKEGLLSLAFELVNFLVPLDAEFLEVTPTLLIKHVLVVLSSLIHLVFQHLFGLAANLLDLSQTHFSFLVFSTSFRLEPFLVQLLTEGVREDLSYIC